MVAQLVLERVGEQRRVADDDDRVHRLDPALVGHSEDRDLEHGGMRPERVLDLERIHVLTAGDDHVLGAIEQREVVLVVEGADVARAVPAVDEGGLGRRRVRPSSPPSRWARGRSTSPATPAGTALAVAVDDAHLDADGVLPDRAERDRLRGGAPRAACSVTIDEVSVAP